MSDHAPKVIIHGGAGPSLQSKGGLEAVREDLHAVVAAVYERAKAGASAMDCVIYGCRQLEDRPRFNAGYGSVLQADGQVRLSAGLMNGLSQRFSGVINVARVEHPIDLAAVLQADTDRVLSESGAMELIRELGIPPFDPVTPQRLQEWLQARQENFSQVMAAVVAADSQARRGTIGVVVLDRQGALAVGTSTGGKGLERLGRVSDAAMPAGTYANPLAAVSCTGIGEDIIDECLAARLVVRISDGLGLGAALAKSFSEATINQRDFGAIAITQRGEVGWGKTSEVLLAAYHTGRSLGDTLELGAGTATGVALQ